MKILLVAVLFIISQALYAQESQSKSHLIPDGIVTEYAGGFGLVSVGILYNFSKNTELGLTTGYTPPEYGKIWTVNGLISHTAIPMQLSESFSLQLLKAGAFVNVNFGNNIYLKWPEHYPKNYYWWNSAIRFGPFIDTELRYLPAYRKLGYGVFFQCLTNDIYLYTYFPNTNTISLYDILYFGAGLKVFYR